MLKKAYTALDELHYDLVKVTDLKERNKFIYYYNLRSKITHMRFLDGTCKFTLPEPG